MTEIETLIIGRTVKVEIDFGVDLPQSMKLTIKSCALGTLEFITDGVVMPQLAYMVQIIETSNTRTAAFHWKVFTTGTSGSRATLSCQMRIEKEVTQTTTTSTTTSTTPRPDTSGYSTSEYDGSGNYWDNNYNDSSNIFSSLFE